LATRYAEAAKRLDLIDSPVAGYKLVDFQCDWYAVKTVLFLVSASSPKKFFPFEGGG
jgi:hypothetical protein